MKVMTFSRFFPQGHPRVGQPTHFVEKIWSGLADCGVLMDGRDFSGIPMDFHVYYNALPKLHTIRAGNRWKAGDRFSPRVWSGKPYNSPQIIIGPDIEVKMTWRFFIANRSMYIESGAVNTSTLERLAQNDGLSFDDFLGWFMPVKKKPQPDFEGQIICWNQNIEY